MDPRAGLFIPAAVLWLGVGAVLGALMVFGPGEWLRFKPAHVAINTMGWMSMLMFAMTLLVVPIFIRRELDRQGRVLAQWVAANAGVAAIFLGHAVQQRLWVVAGWLFVALSAVLFLLNIVRSARHGPPAAGGEVRARRLAHPRFDHEAARPVDRTARRFTETSVLLLILGSGLMALAWANQAGPGGDMAAGFVLRYGWMSTLAWGTAYHMLPRWSGVLPASVRAMTVQLALAILGTLGAAAGSLGGWGVPLRAGTALLALAALVFAANVLRPVLTALFPAVGARRPPWPASGTLANVFIAASWVSLVLAGLAGLGWAAGMPQGWFLGMTHLYLLGWQTLLAYGVAGWLLPHLAGVPFGRPWLYRLQAILALPGTAGVVVVFFLRDRVPGPDWPRIQGAFASLCAAAALAFGVNVLLTVIPVLARRPAAQTRGSHLS